MTKKRRLVDLYVVGKEITFDDGSGEEPIVLFIRKLNPVEQETAVRNANAARARLLALARKPDSDEYQALVSQAKDLDREDQIEFIVMNPLQKFKVAREAELADQEEWKEDNYLQGLSDAWLGGLNIEYSVNQDHPEASRVFKEMQRFAEVVEEEVEEEHERLVREYDSYSDDELVDLVVKELLAMSADSFWVKEYRKNELYNAVREQDRKARYFESLEEVDQLTAEVVIRLSEEFRSLTVEPSEGKDSRLTGDSSPSLEPQEQEETIHSSGLQAVSRWRKFHTTCMQL